MRKSRDGVLMAIAHIIAERGTCNRASVGAVISRDDRVISTGYVGAPSGQPHCIDINVGCQIEDGHCVRTVHAEANAIAFAAREGLATKGSTLYCTHIPCLSCAKLIINAKIVRVVIPTLAGAALGVGQGFYLLRDAGVTIDYIDHSLGESEKP